MLTTIEFISSDAEVRKIEQLILKAGKAASIV